MSKGSRVDETLFAPEKSAPAAHVGKVMDPGSAKISDAELKRIKASLSGSTTATDNAAVVPLSELQRMRGEAVLKTKEQNLAEKKILEEQKEQQRAAAKARKKLMMQREEERKKNAAMSEIELDQRQKQQSYIDRAEEMLMEENENVKHMNQMIQYAKMVTTRDQQLVEKKDIRSDKQKEEERLDLMMEIERLKVIKYHDDREHQWADQRKQGALIIQDQIKERSLQRMREEDMKERERQQMMKQLELLQEEEVKQAQERKDMALKLLYEVEEANRKAILIKEERKDKERDEEERIMQYNIEKAKREQELLEEAERIKAEKEREVQRLREMQERAKDRQAELDALRAKRAQEAQERVEREKERREAAKRAKINQELFSARKQQAKEREIRLMIQAKQERDEFDHIIINQKEEIDAERTLESEKAEIRRAHAEQLKAQILLNEEKRLQDRREYLEEGRQLRKGIEEEKARLEMIKQKKLKQLQDEEVPDKYTSELARKKIVV